MYKLRYTLPLGRKRSLLMAAIGAVLVIGLIAFWCMSLNKGQVIAPPSQGSATAQTSQTLYGVYITFDYSNVYNKRVVPSADNDYEMYNLIAYTNYEKHLSVSVSKLDNNSLDMFTPYTARKSRSDLYSQQALTADGGLATMFVKKDLTERTVFIPHGDKVAIFSFVSTGSSDDVPSEINALVRSFHWNKS